MRAWVGVDAARLCALRRSDQTAARIMEGASRYALPGPDFTELDEPDVAWWRLIVEGAYVRRR
ncbi:hypothetical protein [Streptomyces sp. NPDC059597]|uniref:hypothetical protein n=1 Tax=Streptomyces sp. NPDC059597 TaxID=3346879 RepID=UPI00367FA7A1